MAIAPTNEERSRPRGREPKGAEDVPGPAGLNDTVAPPPKMRRRTVHANFFFSDIFNRRPPKPSQQCCPDGDDGRAADPWSHADLDHTEQRR